MCVALSHCVCADLLQQQWEANADIGNGAPQLGRRGVRFRREEQGQRWGAWPPHLEVGNGEALSLGDLRMRTGTERRGD